MTDARTAHESRWMIAILLLAAVLRLAWIGEAPDGVHADEASNVWNAACLGTAWMDEHGKTLPVFYTRAFNDNRSALFLYVLAPFEAIGGLSPWVFRLPGAISGVACVALLYSITRRLAPTRVVLLAAFLLAIDPTHIQHTRWAHEASITPMLVLATIYLWQRSGLLWTTDSRCSTRWAIAAGLMTGIACYAYAPVRIYLPVLMGLSFLVTRPRQKRRAGLGFAIAFAVLFLPLLYVHLTDAAINARARATWTWAPNDPLITAAGKVAWRYLEHFSPRFVFVTGTEEPTLAPPAGFGALGWAWAPVLLVGMIACLARSRDDAFNKRIAQLALLTLLLYPIGDVLNAAGNAHVLRSLSGWWCFALVGAIGCDVIVQRLGSRRRVVITTLLVMAFLIDLGVRIPAYVARQRDPRLQVTLGVDLREACDFVRPIMQKYDATIFTTTDATYAYAQVLVYLDYDPVNFLDGPYSRGLAMNASGPQPDLVQRFDDVYFLIEGADDVAPMIASAIQSGYQRKTLWVLRPDETAPNDRILHTVLFSNGSPALVVVERASP